MSIRSYENSDPDFPSANSIQTYVFSCDALHCIKEEEREGSFHKVWGELKHEGWRASMSKGVWTHTCPEHSK